MKRQYVEELARRLVAVYPSAAVEFEDPGQLTVTFDDPGQDEPVVLHTTEADLERAVPALGRQVQDAFPRNTLVEAGFAILEVHLEEMLATRRVRDTVVIDATGLVWPR